MRVLVLIVMCLVSIDLLAGLKPGPTTGAGANTVADAFDDAWQRLKAGPAYTAQKTGAFQIRYPFRNGVEFENWIDVPADYDPARRWPLRVQLHGGVGRPAPNAVPPGQPKPTGLPPNRIAGEPQIEDARFFLHDRPSGRVDIERTGNTFVAVSRGVRSFTLLLSPDAVDFTQPVVVRVNGKDLFRGVVKKNVAALEKWAARDRDRTMLYGAELKVDVP